MITLIGNALKNLIKSKNNFSKKSLIGPLRSKKIFIQNGRFRKNLEKKFFEPKRSLSVIFSKNFFVHDNKGTIVR